MKLNALHARLGELIEQGFGDRWVIDDNGNDIAEVEPPEADPGELEDWDERLAVMLACRVQLKDDQ